VRKFIVLPAILTLDSLQQQSLILDLSADSVIIHDLDGNIIFVNKSAYESRGYLKEEMSGMKLSMIISPEQTERFSQRISDLLKNGELFFESTHVRKDGSVFSTETHVKLIEIESKKYCCSAIRDITERKRFELTLKQSEEKYRRLYNETPVLLHSVDRDLRLVDVNDYWLKTMGYARNEVIGRKVTDFYTEASKKYALDVVQPAFFRDGIVKDVSYQFIKKNGDVIDVLLSATAERDAAGNVIHSQSVVQDISERKQVETALHDSEGRLRTVMDNAPDTILQVDRDGTITFINRPIPGLSREQIIGTSVLAWVPLEQHSVVRHALNIVFTTGQRQEYEIMGPGPDGTVREYIVRVMPVMIEGRIESAIYVATDITERKQAEEALLYFQMAVGSAADAIGMATPDGRHYYQNEAFTKLFGLSVREVDGVSGPSITMYTDEKVGRKVFDIIMKGGSFVGEVKMLDKDRKERDIYLRAYSIKNKEGKVVGLVGMHTDITDRKRAEEALRENQARLDLALQSAHMGVWRWEFKENKRYLDDLACQLLGIDPKTFTGTLEEIFRAAHPEDHEKIKTALARTIEWDVPYEPSYRVIWPDGSVHYISVRGRLVRDNTGQPSRINGILWDITDQRLLEEERLKTQKLESIGTLAGGIAHDFNNLLQGIFGYISIAKLTFDQKEKSLAMLTQAEKALHQSVNLTSQLLTFSKGGKPAKKVFALRPLIENSIAFALSGSRISYEIVIEENLRAVEADEGQIGQVIQNIVLNADQAMPLGGMISVSVKNMPATAIVPPTDLQGDFVEISIHDQGTGIPPEHLARIFDPYFTTKEKGSGLGLATVYSIIKNHGGLVRVQSEVGKGTTFLIYLPMISRDVDEPKNPESPAVARKARILVMDDEEIIRAVAGELLTALGHDVSFAKTGEAALAAYRAALESGRPFDVAILDLTIRGGMGGIETLQKLVEIDPDVKAVVSSGYSDDAALSNYRKEGFRSFLKKPYTLDDLQRTMNSLLA
jgi:PAS domain S-box-containing protein